MSLTKKDPSLRVAANDPHLVSLGGGRLSTAVTIHYIPIGDTTIGSSARCSIPLNGSGVLSTHCTIYRSEQNEVTIVPEYDARILIDGTSIKEESNLTQGAMITIGNSNYLRFNNPAEAQLIRSAMGSHERVSMPQIEFTQESKHTSSENTAKFKINNQEMDQSLDIEKFYMQKNNPLDNSQNTYTIGGENNRDDNLQYEHVASSPIDINGLHCPKVFTADLVTVNMSAKDVLGQKYANFAKNLAENHRNDKNVSNATLRNNQAKNGTQISQTSNNANNYTNIPSNSQTIQNNSSNNSINNSPIPNNGPRAQMNGEYLVKVNNTSFIGANRVANHAPGHTSSTAYDRYPKPGSYGGLQIYPMNSINTEINNSSAGSSSFDEQNYLNQQYSIDTDCLEEMLKKCTEYADHQSQSIGGSVTSSPVVQNRIKTNGSLPREKKSPFYCSDHVPIHVQQSLTGSSINASKKNVGSTSTGYENVRIVDQNIEINGQIIGTSKTGGEDSMIGKYIPQSPRTKIRTTCMSPKKEHSFSRLFGHVQIQTNSDATPKSGNRSAYEQLISTFEEKLKLEMQAIDDSSCSRTISVDGSATSQDTPIKRANKNINNLMLNLNIQSHSMQNSSKLCKKPAPAPRHFLNTGKINEDNMQQSNKVISLSEVVTNDNPIKTLAHSEADLVELKTTRKELIANIQSLKRKISELQLQEDEALRELNLEKVLVSAELNSVRDAYRELNLELQKLQQKIHRLEAQRNSTRVMEENQQAKLKQSIEMKQDQVKRLRAMLKQNSDNGCLKEELHNVIDSLECDRKTFEDLEFQYLEEESEWHAYREELYAEEKGLTMKIEEKQLELQHLQNQEITNQTTANADVITLRNSVIQLLNAFKECQERLKTIESSISDIMGELQIDSSDEEISGSNSLPLPQNIGAGIMSQSLFGSAEMLFPKQSIENVMSKSVNENMFYNNNIELPGINGSAPITSTPKRAKLQLVRIEGCELNDVKMSRDGEPGNFVLLSSSDNFTTNPLEQRVPSQDDVERICKVTIDAPISTKGATSKIYESIKEIERNRKLLLAQQGHRVIEHERQKMESLKKKCHDEARAQYISMLSGSESSDTHCRQIRESTEFVQEIQELNLNEPTTQTKTIKNPVPPCVPPKPAKKKNITSQNIVANDQQRLSQPEFDTLSKPPIPGISPRPLSSANSELNSNDFFTDNITFKTELEVTPNATTSSVNSQYETQPQLQPLQDNSQCDLSKRYSVNSVSSGGGGSTIGTSAGERKRTLAKHQRPLTRYLPIFSPDLNLKYHIESAGHQIALCPYVFLDAFSCRGYLHKLGATFHGWSRRWFVLDRQRNAFIYFSDKSERKPRGGAYFSTIEEVYLDHLNASKSGRPHCTFIVKTKKRSFHLQAASDAAARIWIDSIITGAQGNLDY